MRYPLAAGLADIMPSRHPAQMDRARSGIRHIGVFFGFWITLAAMIAFPASPARGGESIWTHNGSTVRWVSSGQDRWFYYVDPRPGLPVVPDTLLFEGQRIGNRLVGTAYVFSSACPPTPYTVEGIIYSETDVSLFGAVPVVDPVSCDLVDYTWDSYNAALRFHYVMTIDRAPVVAHGEDSSPAATSAYTSLIERDCRVLRTYRTNPEVVLRDFFETICPGRNGFSVIFEGGDSRSNIGLLPRGAIYQDGVRFHANIGSFPSIEGKRLEWRYHGSKLVALIVRMVAGLEDDRSKFRGLVVFRVAPTKLDQSCAIGKTTSNEEARGIADDLRKPCL